MKYSIFLEYRNRLLVGHPITTIQGPSYATHDEARKALDRLVEKVKPMDGEYSTCIVEYTQLLEG